MRNIATAARLELESHRRFVSGVTASKPAYKAIDAVNNMGWVVDVYLGPIFDVNAAIIKDVLIASTARSLVADVRQPVLLDRSKQGKYTVIGRADTMPAGAQMPEGSILEPTYHRNEFNLSELKSLFIADLKFFKEPWGRKTWGDGKPWQQINAIDAFGNQVIGLDAHGDPVDTPARLSLTPIKTTVTRHVIIAKRGWGGADPLRWGTDPWGASLQKIVSA